ncbi:MAG: sugar ABC transporter substrate-binding protein [Candidatus Neomarinimicrobiota bacterium]
MKLKLTLLVTVLAIFVALLGCQRGKETAQEGPSVALVMKTLNNPFFIEMQKGAEIAAEKLGINLIVQAAEREVDAEKQLQIVENMIQRKVNAICVTPSGSKEIVAAIVKANRARIPVLVVDTRVDAGVLKEAGGRYATFIGSDNFEGGKIAGEYLIQRLKGTGKVAILEGIPGHETGDARLRGFHSAIDTVPGIEIEASQTANWERDQGFNVFQNILQSHPEVQALFACSDLMALGAIEAIAAAGRTGDIVVIGFDALPEARDLIQKGVMAGSVAQFADEMGRLAVENAYRLINGEKIPEEIPVKIELIARGS